MAVLAGGKIQLEGSPVELMHTLEGRVWTRTIDKAELAEFNKRHNVISTRLFAGRTVVHVLSDTHPGDGFERAPGGLEDVYLATVNASRRAA